MDAPLDADVLIVGAGPVGVMAGLRCAQRGLSVIALDAATDVYPLPRAIGMDDEMQRLFQNAGLSDLVASVSTPLRGAEFVDAERNRITGLDLPDGFLGPNGHPPMAMFEQPPLERGLRAAAVAAGVELRLGVRATAFHDEPDGPVSISIEAADGSASTLRGRWAIGADGAKSTVRRQVGISFVDQGFDQQWLVIDATELDPDCGLPTLTQQVCDPARVITFVPGHETRRRWEIRFEPGDDADRMQDEDHIFSLLADWVRPDQIRIDRTAVYRFHALVADRLREGDIFLAGDAAHQMPPFNGQGMNTGLRDAENLAWKLALVHAGTCGSGLLDTYDEERRPHAEGQVRHSADAGRLIDALAAGEDLDTAAGYGGGRPFPHLEHGIRIGDHPAVGHPLPQPIVDGMLLDDLLGSGFVVITTSELRPLDPAAQRVVDALEMNVVQLDPDVLGPLTDDDRVVIVRPDRYVAAVTDDVDGALVQLGELVRLR